LKIKVPHLADILPGVATPNSVSSVKHGEDEALHIVEGIWKNQLATFEQHGSINVRDELTTNYSSTALLFC
jgi:hypothetical protein